MQQARFVGGKAQRSAAARGVERLLGALKQDLCRTRMARRGDAADLQRRRQRAGRGRKLGGGDRVQKALRGQGHLLGVAAVEDQQKLVAAIAGEHVGRAHLAGQPAGNTGNQLVADVIAEITIRPVEIADRREQDRKRAGRLAFRSGEHTRQMLDGMAAAKCPGQRVETRHDGTMALGLVALGDHPHHAMGARRQAARGAKPASGVLDPHATVAAGPLRDHQPVLHLIGDPRPGVVLRRFQHRLET